MKRVGQTPVGVLTYGVSDVPYVTLEGLLFGTQLFRGNGVLLGEFFSDGDLFVIGETREAHGRAGEIALSIGRQRDDGVGGNGRGIMTALAEIESGDADQAERSETRWHVS